MFGPAPPPPQPVAHVRASLDSPEVRAAEADLARARQATLAQADASIAASNMVVQAAQAAVLAASAREEPSGDRRRDLSSSRKYKLPPRAARPSFTRPESLEHSDEDTRPAGYCTRDK